jgi:allantoate deiminase
MSINILAQAAKELVRRLDQLARISDVRGETTRTFMSPAMGRANALVGAWMNAADLDVREDAVGNIIGRLPSRKPGARTFVFGSHLDTVKNAGRFDGALGVLLPIAAIEVIRRQGIVLPFSVEVVGFSEEEGVRFSSAYLGSKGYTGRLSRSDLKLQDAAGLSVAQVLADHNGREVPPPVAAHAKKELIGYLEVHIEQGPVLESKGLAAGVVSAISGQTRARVIFTGHAGHAGTTPMALRKDALTGAAELILEVETLAKARSPLVATVGWITAHPGATNVIAGEVELSLDVRHPKNEERRAAFDALAKIARSIARRRGLGFSVKATQDNGAVTCSGSLTELLERSVRACQGESLALPSGAGHDAVIVSSVAPVAMLFVRCRKGLSHHPDEYVNPRDLEMALAVVVDFLTRMAYQPAS